MGPVEILQHDNERSLSRKRFEQLSDGPESLLTGPSFAAESERFSHALGNERGLLVTGERRQDRRRGLLARVQALRARDLPYNLGKRPVGDALTVGQAAATQNRYVAGRAPK